MKKRDLAIIVVCFIFMAGMFMTQRYALADSMENDAPIMIVNKNGVVLYEGEPIKVKEDTYIPLMSLKDGLDLLVSYDETSGIAMISGPKKTIRFYKDEGVVLNLQENIQIPPMRIINGQPFIPIEHIKEYIGIQTNILDESKKIILKSVYENRYIAKLSKDSVSVRVEPKGWSYTVDVLKIEDEVEILKEDGEWVKVLTPKGKIGYTKGNDLKNRQTIQKQNKQHEPIWSPEGKIILTWEHVMKKSPDTSKIGNLKGVNVISPTWLSLKDSDGNINNNISKEYIQWAHNRGYKVWALFSNDFNPKLTQEFFKNPYGKEKAIKDLLKLVKDNNIDGINIDFENVYLEDKDNMVMFVRELAAVFHEQNLVVSMDVTVKGGSATWSLCYDRQRLGEVIDYMILMAYDEHWGTSPVSGSVASKNWVQKGIEGLLEDVPAHKLVLGVPFYTRIWMETPNVENPEKINVKSKAASMETVNKIIQQYGLQKTYDAKTGQNYIEYMEGNALNRIWIEDETSMNMRTDLIKLYNLAGLGSWRRGFETENIWYIIDESLKIR
ncbi:glycosyl hydrolase family 18 protein [Anaerophilus nitritogenes]|uniref:glycosyl hydrolase family 18 protein n=1 Tax=Anaerophilus nitritogenes TaxID=2498136 RepID=UPI00101D586F|nr:glycosyl hydrolase family 18 protein [Anaerophilus nitritogenes]